MAAPAGYEFSALFDASVEQSGLSGPSRTQLASITSPVQIQVFVTPT